MIPCVVVFVYSTFRFMPKSITMMKHASEHLHPYVGHLRWDRIRPRYPIFSIVLNFSWKIISSCFAFSFLSIFSETRKCSACSLVWLVDLLHYFTGSKIKRCSDRQCQKPCMAMVKNITHLNPLDNFTTREFDYPRQERIHCMGVSVRYSHWIK